MSSACQPLTALQLRDLLSLCNENNRRDDITGMLLHKDGNFMQVLEGEAAAVRLLHARIERDPRHCGLITLVRGPVADRRFTHWSMGFRDLSTAPPLDLEGYRDFLDTPLTSPEFTGNPSQAQRLLMTFRAAMER